MKKILWTLLVFGSLAVSCEKYDDTEIKDSISDLEKKVDALQQLSDEVSALQDIVKGMVTVVSCAEKNGKHVLVFSNGKSLEIPTSLGKIPVVTFFIEKGKSYWAYVYDGETIPFMLNGQLVPVTASTPQMRVGDNGNIEVSVDGGKTWVETQVNMPESLFSGLEVEDDSVLLTLADGYSQIRVPFIKESEYQFVSFSGKQYFSAGQTKLINIGMVGVESYTVTEKPEGWKATLSEGQLKVTAPAEGTGETSGYIKMLGIGKEPKIAQVYVTLGTAPVLLSISSDMNVSITPNPQTCFYGACLLEDFNAKAIAAELSGVYNPMMSRYPFASSAMNFPLADMFESIEEGATYVVWVLPATGNACTELDIIYEAVSSVGLNFEATDVTFEDAKIYAGVKGTDKYYLVPNITVADLIQDLNGSFASSYDRYLHDSAFRGYLSDLINSPLAGEEYSFLMLPFQFGKPLSSAAKEFKVQLNALTNGGSSTVSMQQVAMEYKSVNVKISASQAYKVYFTLVSEAEYSARGYADDSILLTYLSTFSGMAYTGEYTQQINSLESGSSYYAVAVAVDNNGVLGTPSRLKVSTKAVEYSSSVVTIGQVQVSLSSATVPLTSSSDIVKYRYMFLSGSGADYWYYTYIDSDKAAEDALIYGTCEYIEVDATAVGQGITFSDLYFGVNYIFRVVGYDKDGKVTHLAKADVTPTVGSVVKATDAKWAASKPEVNAAKTGTSLSLSVEFPNTIFQAVITKMSSEEYDASFPTAPRLKTDHVISHSYAFTIYDNVYRGIPSEWYISSDLPYVLIAWEDENGWHEPLVYDSATGTILNK